jgi:PAS domain S-box-containing protein
MTHQNMLQAKILIVDDYVDEIRILSEELQPDYQVYAATDGEQALARVASNPPDLILLDVEMPGMNGHDVCRRLKADKATKEIPIIFITAKDDDDDEAEGLALGAVDYITKPFRIGVVRARMKTILKLKSEIDLRKALAEDLRKLNNELETKVEEQVARLHIADEEIRESEELLRIILLNILDLVFMTDDDSNFTFLCSNMPHIIGYSVDELWTMGNATKLIGDAGSVTEALGKKGTIHDIEKTIVDKKGEARAFLINVRSVSIGNSTQLWTCREITHRKKLEDQLRQAYKMEAIGTLAGGIAHDFNNILTAIVGYAEISRDSVNDASPLKKYLSRVLEASTRAKELVNQILMFSRETEKELKPMIISLPVKEALQLIRASVPTTIDIEQNIQTKATVMADPTQIHQLVMNLCTNAAHAMRKNGGKMTVRLTDEMIHDEHRDQYPDLSPGTYIKLSVSDTGHGIPSHLINRIFDPFFSTKEKGEGTGMGLSVVHGIVKNHGGAITVASERDKGAAFEIMLPSIKEMPAEDRQPHDVIIPGGSETILLIDDEQMIVDVGTFMLESQGYRVLSCTAPIQALELFKENPEKFDLIVTDMTMPKMTGLDLAHAILQIRPDIPIIMCTGFSEDLTEETASDLGISEIIYKPILNRDMTEKVRKVLDRP